MNNSKDTNTTIKVTSIVAKVFYALALAGFIAYLTVYMICTIGVDWIAYITGGLLLVAIVLSAIIQASLLVEKLHGITQNWIFAFGLILSIVAIVLRVLLGRQGVSFLLYTFTIASTSFLYVMRRLFGVKTNALKVTELSWSLVFSCIATVVCIVYIVLFLDAVLLMFGCARETINNVFALLAAALGGGLTLAGVAWTIKNTAKEKADEEKKKAKPVFVSNRVFEDIDAKKEKVCFEELDVTTSFDCHVIAEIENSNNSSFTMLQVYHDGQWRKIEGDSIILPNKKVYFDFLFTNDVNNLFLEVKDCLDNSYFYEIKVLQWALINGATATSSHVEHTIRTLKEITIEEINERIKSEAKQ